MTWAIVLASIVGYFGIGILAGRLYYLKAALADQKKKGYVTEGTKSFANLLVVSWPVICLFFGVTAIFVGVEKLVMPETKLDKNKAKVLELENLIRDIEKHELGLDNKPLLEQIEELGGHSDEWKVAEKRKKQQKMDSLYFRDVPDDYEYTRGGYLRRTRR